MTVWRKLEDGEVYAVGEYNKTITFYFYKNCCIGVEQ